MKQSVSDFPDVSAVSYCTTTIVNVMNKRIELGIYAVLYAMFGISHVKSIPQSDHYLSYTVVSFLHVGVLFATTRYFVGPRLQAGNALKALSILVLLMAVAFVTSGYLYALYVEDLIAVKGGEAEVSLFEPLVAKEAGILVVLPVILGMLHLVRWRKQSVKRALSYIGAALVVLALGFGVKYAIDVNYRGSASIHFIEGAPASLDDILAQKQFRGKAVYIDLWFSSCGPCIQDFRKLPALKEQLRNNDIAYLYLARETSHPHSRQLWKNAIKKYNLSGWHYYMTDAFRTDLWSLISANDPGAGQAYPRYLLADRQHEIVSFDAKRPSDIEALANEIRSVLND